MAIYISHPRSDEGRRVLVNRVLVVNRNELSDGVEHLSPSFISAIRRIYDQFNTMLNNKIRLLDDRSGEVVERDEAMAMLRHLISTARLNVLAQAQVERYPDEYIRRYDAHLPLADYLRPVDLLNMAKRLVEADGICHLGSLRFRQSGKCPNVSSSGLRGKIPQGTVHCIAGRARR